MDNASREGGKRADYFSYLLRLWRGGEEREGWRASLHDPHTGERVGSASMDELFGYLQKQTGMAPGTDGGQEEGWER